MFSSVPPDFDEFLPLDDDGQAALDELVKGPTGIEAVGFDSEFRWSIALRDADLLVLFGQGEDPDGGSWAHVQFDKRDGPWTPIAWGGCPVVIEAPGFGPAMSASDPDRPVDPASTELPIVIKEQNCASGRAPTDREIVPVVNETDESVTIVVLVALVEGGADCPDNPWHPVSITLDSPLGSRELLDGHEYPIQPVALAD